MKRKPRDTSYSMTYKLIDKFGEEKLRNVWAANGMYKSADILSNEIEDYVSPATMRYLSYKFDWIREVSDHDLPFVKGVIAGSIPADYYRHVKIVGLEQIGQDQGCSLV